MKIYPIIKAFVNTMFEVGTFGLLGSLLVALTFWVQEYWPTMPLFFKILWLIGSVNILFLMVKKRWSCLHTKEKGE